MSGPLEHVRRVAVAAGVSEFDALAMLGAVDGDEALAVAVLWIRETTLRTGGAMLVGIPDDRMDRLRREARKAIKRAIGGSVRTQVLDHDMLIVTSPFVIDSKSDDRRLAEQQLAADVLNAVALGNPPPPVPWSGWRALWSELVPS